MSKAATGKTGIRPLILLGLLMALPAFGNHTVPEEEVSFVLSIGRVRGLYSTSSKTWLQEGKLGQVSLTNCQPVTEILMQNVFVKVWLTSEKPSGSWEYDMYPATATRAKILVNVTRRDPLHLSLDIQLVDKEGATLASAMYRYPSSTAQITNVLLPEREVLSPFYQYGYSSPTKMALTDRPEEFASCMPMFPMVVLGDNGPY